MRTRFNWAQLWPKPHAAGAAMLRDQSSAVLSQLRELRATLAGHTARLDRVEEHVDQIDGQLRDIHLLIVRALEQAAPDHLRLHKPGDPGPEAGASCQIRAYGQEGLPEHHLESRIFDIEHRLTRVEDKLGG